MRCRRHLRCYWKCLLRLFLGGCVALTYIEIQLLPLTGNRSFLHFLRREPERPAYRIKDWKNLCKGNRTDEDFEKYAYPTENNIGNVNRFLWTGINGSDINSLLKYPLFPNLPVQFGSLMNTSYVSLQGVENYGQWITGFIHVDISGIYTFAIASDDSSEFRLSPDDDPTSVHVMATVGRGDVPGLAFPDQFDLYEDQRTLRIKLEKCKKYYFEIVHKQGEGDGFVQLYWKRPGSLGFHPIRDTFFTPLVPRTESYPGIKDKNFRIALGRVREDRMRLTYDSSKDHTRVPWVQKSLLEEVLPLCLDYSPSYLVKDRNGGDVLKPRFPPVTNVFPEPSKGNFKFSKQGNQGEYLRMVEGKGKLQTKKATVAASRYLAQLDMVFPGKYKLQEINRIEQKRDAGNGDRYILDLAIHEKSTGQRYRIVEYVYLYDRDPRLCKITFPWKQTSTIYVIVPVVKLDRWARHIMYTVEDVFTHMRERNVRLIVINYSQETRTKLGELLTLSTLPMYSVVQGQGEYSKSKALNAASKTTEYDAILLLIEPGIQLPFDVFDQVRKHCIAGYMAFSPLVFHLVPGSQPRAPVGFWGKGVKLFAIYKEGWDRVDNSDSPVSQAEEEFGFINRVFRSGIDVERVAMDGFYYWK